MLAFVSSWGVLARFLLRRAAGLMPHRLEKEDVHILCDKRPCGRAEAAQAAGGLRGAVASPAPQAWVLSSPGLACRFVAFGFPSLHVCA